MKKLDITDVKIQSIPKEGNIKAHVCVVFNDVLFVHDIKIIQGAANGTLFVAMPSRRVDGGRFVDVVHFNDPQSRAKFNQAVLETFETAKANSELAPTRE